MFKLISDGSCDFTDIEVKKYDIDVVPFYVSLDHTNFLKEGVDISKADYFKRLSTETDLYPKTSQPSPQDYVDVFEAALKEGKDVLCVTISSKLSGSFSSANIAADMVREDYPERKVVVLDSKSVSIAHGLIMKEIVKMRDNGLSLDETEEKAKEVFEHTRAYFTLDTLEYLKKGGRVGPTQAMVGGILGLRPILQVVDGEVKSLESVRGKKKMLSMMETAIVETLKDNKNEVALSVGYILSEEEAVGFKNNIETALGIEIDNPVTEIGAAVGTHAGPGALAIAYCKKYEALA
jgi:DegV family protein with EDD domain